MSDYIKEGITVKELQEEPGAVALINDFKDQTDPKYVGPGHWNVIHRLSYKARTHEQQLHFIDDMKEICYGFPCTVCKGHCTEYISNHPLEEYIDILIEINGEKIALGMFIWTWKFHNAVNTRTKKPIMSWDTAYNLYSQTESLICSKNCLAAEDPVNNNDVPVMPEPILKATLLPIKQPTQFRMISGKQIKNIKNNNNK